MIFKYTSMVKPTEKDAFKGEGALNNCVFAVRGDRRFCTPAWNAEGFNNGTFTRWAPINIDITQFEPKSVFFVGTLRAISVDSTSPLIKSKLEFSVRPGDYFPDMPLDFGVEGDFMLLRSDDTPELLEARERIFKEMCARLERARELGASGTLEDDMCELMDQYHRLEQQHKARRKGAAL